MITPRISPCLWFDSEAEDAARFYVGIFRNARINSVSHYGDAGQEIHGQKAGSVMMVNFELDGTTFNALNAGPKFKFNEAISMQINCKDQEEVDYYWNRLSEGGDPSAQACGWLKDKFGLFWQVTPVEMEEMFREPNSPGAQRAMNAMLRMKKFDIAALRRAYDG